MLLFSKTPAPPNRSCALHTYLTLPSNIFVDKYQLSSLNLLESNNIRALLALSGETNLEAPDWVVSRWGSTMLLELSTPPSSPPDKWSIEIPLHLRYMKINHLGKDGSTQGQVSASMPWPVIFWACPAEKRTKMDNNPFDRVNLGYDGLFGPRTMFYHLQPSSNESLAETIQVPVLDVSGAAWIECGTVGTAVLAFAWICWTLVQSSRPKFTGVSSVQAEKED